MNMALKDGGGENTTSKVVVIIVRRSEKEFWRFEDGFTVNPFHLPFWSPPPPPPLLIAQTVSIRARVDTKPLLPSLCRRRLLDLLRLHFHWEEEKRWNMRREWVTGGSIGWRRWSQIESGIKAFTEGTVMGGDEREEIRWRRPKLEDVSIWGGGSVGLN